MAKNIKKFVNKLLIGDWVEITRGIPDDIYHCVITSPPYWGQRDYKIKGQIGCERTPEEHIEKLVEGFREIRRVLRPDGILFLNYGDKYSDGLRTTNSLVQRGVGQMGHVPYKRAGKNCGMEQGNTLMLPVRIALAMQADGWILRNDICWAKGVSFCEDYAGSPMVESINGTRWERHRIKVGDNKDGLEKRYKITKSKEGSGSNRQERCVPVEWKDCPGCKKCEPNDGLILRKGSWRCTRAHEYIFQFVKSNNYFGDMEAIKEKSIDPESFSGRRFRNKRLVGESRSDGASNTLEMGTTKYIGKTYISRNLRDVWVINPKGYGHGHYSTFPKELVIPCIKVAASEKGVCPKCGSQWARIIESKQVRRYRPHDRTDRHMQGHGVNSCGNTVSGVETKTIGWKATCDCGIEETTPAIVFDPFMGSGTVAIVAAELNRYYTGIDINPEYIKEHARRRVKERMIGIPVADQRMGFGGLLE